MKSLVLIMLLASASLAHASQPPERRGPPQEFFDACKGKKDGEKVSAKTPHGDTVKGTCRIVMMPADGERRPPPRKD